MMSTITVLLSTYNGEKYIKEQLDSLLQQMGDIELKIVVRDDGSSDNTLSILSDYQLKFNNIVVLQETNCGAEESFNKLCLYALKNSHSDYYAFCDQDDVWHKDKLSVAVQILEKYEDYKPNLYFSNLRMVDENLRFIKNFYDKDEVIIDKNKTLVQIYTYGCTCVFNRKALEVYCKIGNNKTLHDNWLYVVCSYLGNVYYDTIGHIDYRQHDDNLSGHKVTGFSLIKQRVVRAFKGNLGNDYETMANQLLEYRSEISDENLHIIQHVANYRRNISSRLFLLFSNKYKSRSFFKNLCIMYRIFTNSL